MQLQPHIISFACVVLLFLNATEPLEIISDEENFVTNLISIHFSKCSIIITPTSNINEATESNNYSTQKNLWTSGLLRANNLHAPTFITTKSSGSIKLQAQDYIHKHGSACKLLIAVFTEELRSGYTNWFQETFIPPFGNGIIRRDKDYFVFIVSNEVVANRLLQSGLSLLIRFKLALFLDGGKHVIKSFCLYCEQRRVISTSNNPKDSLSKIFPDFTNQFNQNVVRVEAPTKYTATYEMEQIIGRYRHKRGIHTIVFNTVANKLNMTYTLKPCSKFGDIQEGATGVLLPNGTWAGCMGDLIRNETDVSLSTSPDQQRYNFAEFTSAMAVASVTFTTSKPGLLYSWKTIFSAFHPVVWWMVFFSVLAATFTICMIENFLKKYVKTKDIISGYALVEMAKVGMGLIGYLAGQDFVVPRHGISIKFAYLVWLYCGFVIGAAYVCSLQSLIVSPGLEFVPTTFKELVELKPYYKWGASKGFREGIGEELFKNSNNPIMNNIFYEMKADKDEVSCTLTAAKSDYACFNWDILQEFHFITAFADRSGNHPFQLSLESTFNIMVVFATRKREIYVHHFNEFIKRAYDMGLTKEIIANDWRKYRMGLVNSGEKQKYLLGERQAGPQPFPLDSVKGSFIILGSGMILSVTEFFIELLKRGVKSRSTTAS